MRKTITRCAAALLAIAAALLLPSCGTIQNAMTSSTTTSSSASSAPSSRAPAPASEQPVQSQFLYGGQDASDLVDSARIDPASGAVTPGPSISDNTTGYIISVATDPKGRFFYTSDTSTSSAGNSGIGMFAINRQTGKLNPVVGSPILTREAGDIAVNPAGTLLYRQVSRGYEVYAINHNSGGLSLAAGSPFGNPPPGFHFAITRDGRFLVAPGVTAKGAQIDVESIDAAGIPRPVAGSPFTTSAEGNAVALDPAGHSIYIGGTGKIWSVPLEANGGIGSSVTSVTAGTGDVARLAVAPGSRFLYAIVTAAGGVKELRGFALNGSTGVLTEVPGSPFKSDLGDSAIVVDYSGKYLYLSAWDAGEFTFAIDPASGALRQTSAAASPKAVFLTTAP